MQDIVGLAEFLSSMNLLELIFLLSPILLFEIPRYIISLVVLPFSQKLVPIASSNLPKYSLVLAAHNGFSKVQELLATLDEQTHKPAEIIIVSDGSDSERSTELINLQLSGQVKVVHILDLRGGKSAALNLALHDCIHSYIVCIDADTSFDRFAMQYILSRSVESGAAAVAGNICVGNDDESLLAAFQGIEYSIRIGIGKTALDVLNQVSLISGAFGAFKREALERNDGYDAVSGEDLDVTLRIRRAGFQTAFCNEALCYTNAPTNVVGLFKQRLRWERDAFSLRLRRHLLTVNPLKSSFNQKEIYHFLDFVIFDLMSVLYFPVFVAVVVNFYAEAALSLLITYVFSYLLLDLGIYWFARKAIRNFSIRTLFLIPGYTLYSIFINRPIRFFAYATEILFYSSKNDDFVPNKVRSYNNARLAKQ